MKKDVNFPRITEIKKKKKKDKKDVIVVRLPVFV